MQLHKRSCQLIVDRSLVQIYAKKGSETEDCANDAVGFSSFLSKQTNLNDDYATRNGRQTHQNLGAVHIDLVPPCQ